MSRVSQQSTPSMMTTDQARVMPERVVLAGNPNVGKSVIFQALTGQYVDVSNFPGTTVTLERGQWVLGCELVDAPGVYGLSALSDEELVAEQAILEADVVVNVVSATSLQRDLFLTQQLIDWGCRLLVVVNQLDELIEQSLDLKKLSQQLGVAVIGTVAVKGQGIDAIEGALSQARTGHALTDLPEAQKLRGLERDLGSQMKIYGLRRQRVNHLVASVLSAHNVPKQPAFSKQLGYKLLHPIWGALALVAILLALYQVIGVWVAGDLVNLLEGQLLLGLVVPVIQQAVQAVVPESLPWLNTLLAGEFGVVTMSLQYIVGVMFPLVLGFYLYLSVLEDSGYLPRLAVLADGLLNKLGLNGRAIIPIILGLGCVTMATLSTRVLTSQRERTIANALLGITIPCSAQLGVIMGMMALAGGLPGWVFFVSLLTLIFSVIGVVLNKILPGQSTPLLLDLPPMRLPRLSNVLKKAWIRSWGFLQEATPLFILGAALVSVAQVTGALSWIEAALAPVTMWLLHLPGEAASAFIMGMVRRDFGLAGFYQLQGQLTTVQMMTSLMVITLFVPCIASATMMWKERGWREGAGVLALSWVLAFGMGAVVTRGLEWVTGLF